MTHEQKGRAEEDNERLEVLVHARTLELSELASYLNQVREDEKLSLARQLHDELGSLLTAARLDIAFIRSKCAGSHPELVSKCDRIAAMLDQGAALKRRIIDNLRPATLDLLGLGSAVRELVENFASESQAVASAQIDDEIDQRNDDALAVYRIIEEALTNVKRHAQASEVRVMLERAGDMLRVHVRDNGKGFDPLAARSSQGNGLAAMRQRVRSMGGRVSIVSLPGAGAEVEVWLPFRPVP
jgi:signal transduction histidine kinase